MPGMYLIVVKFPVKHESADRWMDIVSDYTQHCRREEGNIFFEWSRSIEDPLEFVLVEAFTDEGAAAHVQSTHFTEGIEAMRPHITGTPKIVSRQVDGDGWEAMGELQVD
jgi:quinol monooxygenase YgiN